METKVNNSTSVLPRLETTKTEAGTKAKKGQKTGDVSNLVSNPSSSETKNSAAVDYDVSLSPRAREMAEARARAFEIAKNTSDVREDKVAALKAQIAEGKYQADPSKIADGMLREAIMERLAENEEGA